MNYAPDTSACGGHCVNELIRARAYQLFQANGHQPDRALDDWLCAEREVRQHLGFEFLCEQKIEPLF